MTLIKTLNDSSTSALRRDAVGAVAHEAWDASALSRVGKSIEGLVAICVAVAALASAVNSLARNYMYEI